MRPSIISRLDAHLQPYLSTALRKKIVSKQGVHAHRIAFGRWRKALIVVVQVFFDAQLLGGYDAFEQRRFAGGLRGSRGAIIGKLLRARTGSILDRRAGGDKFVKQGV